MDQPVNFDDKPLPLITGPLADANVAQQALLKYREILVNLQELLMLQDPYKLQQELGGATLTAIRQRLLQIISGLYGLRDNVKGLFINAPLSNAPVPNAPLAYESRITAILDELDSAMSNVVEASNLVGSKRRGAASRFTDAIAASREYLRIAIQLCGSPKR